ncbi:MAG: hypothetical protein GX222_06945 [Ruminococcaceae bacterium]|nr:hypothetical protein [Oscillospiraceae bacterium]
MTEHKRWQKMLAGGMICAFISVALGDMPIGWAVYPKTGNKILNLVLGCGNLSLLQMATGLLFGAVFIPFQYYGFKAIAEIISKDGCTLCAKITELGARAYTFGGGTVHVLCVAAMFLCKTENTGSLLQIPQSVIDFSLWCLFLFK